LSQIIKTLKAPSTQHRGRVYSWLQGLLVTALFGNATLYFVGATLNDQWAWIDYRNYPGGPVGFIEEVDNIWPSIMSNIALVLITFIADGVLVRTDAFSRCDMRLTFFLATIGQTYRCYIVWGRNLVIVALPIIHWVAVIGEFMHSRLVHVFTCVLSWVSPWMRAHRSERSTFRAACKEHCQYRPCVLVHGSDAQHGAHVTYSFPTLACPSRHQIVDGSRSRPDVHRCCRYGTLSSFRDIHEQALIPGMLISQIIESAASYALITIIFIVLYGLQNTSMAIFSVFLSKQRYDCIIDFLEKSSLIIPCP
jgi:hypothetical protein